jgi:serine/threonine protein kinase
LNVNRYVSPENIYNNDMKPSDLKAADIWSLGCVFAEMLKGAALFEARDKNVLLSQIFAVAECRPNSGLIARYPALNGVPQVKSSPLAERFAGIDVSEDAMDLLQSMLIFDPGTISFWLLLTSIVKRISAMEALQHKYFIGANFIDIHRTCPYSSELTDEEVPKFVNTQCGGL